MQFAWLSRSCDAATFIVFAHLKCRFVPLLSENCSRSEWLWLKDANREKMRSHLSLSCCCTRLAHDHRSLHLSHHNLSLSSASCSDDCSSRSNTMHEEDTWAGSTTGSQCFGLWVQPQRWPLLSLRPGSGRWRGEQWPGPFGGRQWLTQPLKLQRMSGAEPELRTSPPPTWPSLCPMVPWGQGDDTFKDGPWASDGLRTTLKEQQSRVLALWALE